MDKIRLFSGDYTSFLKGGFQKGIVTGIYGPAGSGKTLTCMLASLSPDLSGKKIIYIDTERGFYVERFKQLSQDYASALDRIIFFFPKSFGDLRDISSNIAGIAGSRIGLIVVDTISSFYRLEIAMKRDSKKLNSDFVAITARFSEIAKKLGIPVIFTSQVYADMKNNGKLSPIGGFILKKRCKFIIEMDKLHGSYRKASIVRDVAEELVMEDEKSRSMVFMITNKGIKSIEDKK